MSQQQPPPPPPPFTPPPAGHPVYAMPIADQMPAPGPPMPTSVMVLTILGIIFGALATLCTPVALLPFFIGRFMPQGTTGNPAVDVILDDPVVRAWTIASVLIGTLGAIWLLTTSIGALRRCEWGRRGMIGYAWFAIGFALLCIAMTAAVVAPAQFRAASTASRAGTPQAYGLMGGAIGSTIGSIFGALFGCVLPVCILIFLRKAHVREAFAQTRNQKTAQVR